ncbi:MAG TPA: nucleotidyltransferase domain-containing protein [Gemmatimonadaceae bacterium]|nr:nucleotidyltransferase domain-containing protein [Gemmatimonadaceae bacterium]
MRPSPASTLYHPLDEVLGTRALVRVVRVLAGHGGRLAVADIAHRARLTLPSVRTALRRLLDLEVATAIGAGRSMVCGLRRSHPLVPVLVQLFQAEQQQASAVLDAVRDAAGRLTPAPLAVWLFGSVARGEDDAASDIDIALVTAVPEPSAQADALRDAISRTRAASVERVAVITMAPADVRRAAREKTPFWESLKRDAVVLLGDAPADVLARARRGRER